MSDSNESSEVPIDLLLWPVLPHALHLVGPAVLRIGGPASIEISSGVSIGQ